MGGAERGTALRVGLLAGAEQAAVVEAGAALDRLARLLPSPTLLRLLHLDGPQPACGPAWTPIAIAGPPDSARALLVRTVDLLLTDRSMGQDVELALDCGIPVLVLAPGRAPLWLANRFWQVSTRPAPEGPDAWEALAAHLRVLLAPPKSPEPEALRAIEAGTTLPPHRIWGTHRLALALLARPPRAAAATPGKAEFGWWARLYEPADALASAYADRYRSSYTIVLGLAALALLSAVIGLRSEHHWRYALPEALCLAGITALVWLNERADWRSRLIQCRLLSELCRKQAALAFVGRSLPVQGIAALTTEGDLAWFHWRFATAVRAAPVPGTVLTGAALDTARRSAAAVLLQGQRAYHQARAAGNTLREARLVRGGTILFGGTVAFVALKLVLLLTHHEGAEAAGLVAAALPAGAAALFGFRAYAELDLLVQQSERLIGIIDAAETTLAAIDVERPGADLAIGDILEATAAQMLEDVAGWIQISRIKAVEPG